MGGPRSSLNEGRMEQLIYISTARADPPLAMIQSILAISHYNNGLHGLTGLLIVGGRRFLQVLEGPSLKLDATYLRIRADSRHFALVQLSRKTITTRSFPDWEMGYQSGNGANEFDALTTIVERLTGGVDNPSLRAELQGFAALHSRAA